MGSPVSAVIANLVMEDIEQRALASSPVTPLFWKRYVDDGISAVSKNEVENLLNHLNSVEPSIQFGTITYQNMAWTHFRRLCRCFVTRGRFNTKIDRLSSKYSWDLSDLIFHFCASQNCLFPWKVFLYFVAWSLFSCLPLFMMSVYECV